MIKQQFNEVIKRISRKIEINEIPREIRIIYRAHFNEPKEIAKGIFRYTSFSTEGERNSYLYFNRYFDKNPNLFELGELEGLIDILLSNQNYYQKIRDYEKVEEKIGEKIKRFIIYVFQKEQRIDFEEDVLQKYVNELEAYFRGDEVIITSKHPLDGFYSNVEQIDLETGLFIERIPLDKREELYTGISFDPGFNKSHILENEYWLINEYSFKKGVVNEYAYFIEKEFLKFLRIFKSGRVGMYYYQLKSNYWNPDLLVGGVFGHADTFVVGHGDYIIQGDEIVQFTDLWRKYREIDFSHDRALNIAIKRFNDSFTRREVEDKIIDLMIAFEAMFLKENEKMELTFKLSLRTAIFLEDVDAERENLFEFMKKAYDTRSDIVHGVKTKDKIKVKRSINAGEYDEYTLNEFVNKLEDIFRECLLKYIQKYRGYQINKLIDLMDKKSLNNALDIQDIIKSNFTSATH
ncbi:MAG: hypothetical protein KAT65_25175 [Methanophagales archaeon]|nr:hypothetical protein [Methanophagales archaeon]